METRIKLVLSAALSLCAFAAAASDVVYVSPSGDDRGGDGSAAKPFVSLQRALDHAATLPKSDTLYIKVRGGEYRLTEPIRVTPENSGSASAPVVVMRDGAEPAVFRGSATFGGFEPCGEGVWRARVPFECRRAGFEQMYVGGERRFRAQLPDRGEFLDLNKVEEFVIDSSATNRTGKNWAVLKVTLGKEIALRLGRMSRGEWNDAIIDFYHKWDVTRLRLHYLDAEQGEAYFVEDGMAQWNPIDVKSKFVVENCYAALDSAGEWYLDRDAGWLYYIPMPDEDPETLEVSVPVVDKFLVIAGDEASGRRAGHVIFRDLSFREAGYWTPAAGNAAAQAAAPVEAAVMADFAEGVVLERCEVAHTGLGGVWFRRGCRESSVLQCHLHDLGANGVKIGQPEMPEPDMVTNRITVDNSIIQHGGCVFPCAVGVVIFHASDNNVTHNDIADFRYSGVSVGWVWGYAESPAKRNHIDYNHIHHLGWGELSDMGGVYTLGLSEGTTVNGNVVHHIYSRYYGGWGLYTDEGSTGITLRDNLVYACKSAGFHQHYGKGNLICNNIFACQIRAQLEATRQEEHLSFTFKNNIVYFDSGDLAGVNWKGANMLSDNNCFWDTRSTDLSFQGVPMAEWKAAGKDVHSVVADPGFVDAARFDFRLRNRRVARKIGFEPFDYSQAGVYGSEEWRGKARLDPALEEAFDRLVEQTEALGISQW